MLINARKAKSCWCYQKLSNTKCLESFDTSFPVHDRRCLSGALPLNSQQHPAACSLWSHLGVKCAPIFTIPDVKKQISCTNPILSRDRDPLVSHPCRIGGKSLGQRQDLRTSPCTLITTSLLDHPRSSDGQLKTS